MQSKKSSERALRPIWTRRKHNLFASTIDMKGPTFRHHKMFNNYVKVSAGKLREVSVRDWLHDAGKSKERERQITLTVSAIDGCQIILIGSMKMDFFSSGIAGILIEFQTKIN